MNFTLIILTIILIIAIIIFSFIFIKLNKRRTSQNTDQKRSKDDKAKLVNMGNNYPSFSDQIHTPINLDRSLLEIEEVSKRPLINEDDEQFSNEQFSNEQFDEEQFSNDNSQIRLISNSEFIF